MEIKIDFSLLIQAAGFIVFILVMWKSNKNGFEKVDLKFDSLIAILALEKNGVEGDLDDLNSEVEGIKSQFKGEIYPRLNSAERKIDKNCRALQDFEKFCNERHKNLKAKET